ncbi:MAG: alpha/beta hydrolase family protein [Ferrimicrobium sp.]
MTSRHRFRVRRIFVALAVVVVVGGGGLFTFVALVPAGTPQGTTGTTTTIGVTTTTPPPTSTTTTTSPPSGVISGVGEQQVNVVEPGRVMCVPSTGACSTRSYLLDIFYPSSTAVGSSPVVGATVASVGAPYPLIVFGGGFNIDPSAYLLLLGAWVRAGYVVAAPRFPLSSQWALNHYGVNLNDIALADAFESDMLNQPFDMGAAITEVTNLNNQSGTLLYRRVNTTEVAAAGQSDGGDTALAFAENTCCRSPLVKAAVILSGAEFSPYHGSYFPSPALPLLVIQGSADTVNPPVLSETIYDSAPAPKYLQFLLGAGHLEAYTQANVYQSAVVAMTEAFFATYLKGESISQSRVGTIGSVPGVASEETDAD